MDNKYIKESIEMFEDQIREALKRNVEFAKAGRQDQIIENNKLIQAYQLTINNLSVNLKGG